MRKLISKYWPEHALNFFDLGYKKALFPCVYDLSKAKRILNWKPAFNFDEWLTYCNDKNLDFKDFKRKLKEKRSLIHKIKRKFFKIKKKILRQNDK